MAKRSEYLESKIKPCEYKGKNGKIYKKYVFHFEGKTYSFASYQKTYQTYERLVNGEDIRETKKEDKKSSLQSQTIEDGIKKWFIEYYMQSKKPSTIQRAHQSIEHQIIPQVGKIKILELKHSDIQRMVNQSGMFSTKKKAFEYLRLFYKDMKYLKYFEDNPFERITLNNLEPPKNMTIFEQWEIDTIQNNYSKYKYGYGYLLLTKTGCRVSEILALDLGNFKINNNGYYIDIIKTVSNGGEYDNFDKKTRRTADIMTPKTKNSVRTIPISKITFEQLAEYLGFNDNIEQAKKYIENNPNRPLLVTSNGTRVQYTSFKNIFYRLLNENGIERKERTIHSLRHSFATQSVEDGVNIATLSSTLGHSRTSITYDIYVHSNTEKMREYIEKEDIERLKKEYEKKLMEDADAPDQF